MSAELIIVASISLFLASLFLLSEFVNLKMSVSVVAGIFIGYFFFSMLPEIDELSNISHELSFLKYFWVALGFVVMYLVSMFIIKGVEKKSIRKLEELSVSNGKTQSEKDEIRQLKREIQRQASEEIAQFDFYLVFLYHLLVGFIGVSFLLEDLFSGIIFFVIAWLISLSIHTFRPKLLIADFNIREIKVEEPLRHKVILGFSPLIGVMFSLISIALFGYYLDLGITTVLFSIVTGLMFYYITLELMPEPDKLKGILFLAGLIGFSIFIILVHFLALL